MNNNDKWNDMIQESFKYPDELYNMEVRFQNRIKKEKIKYKTIISSLSAIAASIMFIILINTNTAFANAVAELPVIGKLSEYVKFDKSLSKAIENEYVQEVNLVAWDGNNRLLLPYIIADEKKLILFFQMPEEFKLQSNQWVNIFSKDIKNVETGEEVDGYGYSSSGFTEEDRKKNHGFIMQNFFFEDGKLPKVLDLEVEVEVENIAYSDESIDVGIPYDFKSNSTFETMGTFNFHIELGELAKPIIYEINETHTILGQEITVKDMRVYPTGTEVNFTFADENTAFVKGLELEVVEGGNKVLKTNGGGINSSSDDKNTWMRVFIESNYFDKPNKQELLIRGIRLLDKNEEFITVDIENKTISPEIKGMAIKQVLKESGYTTIVFATERKGDDNFGMFKYEYKDTDGKVYRLEGEGTSTYESYMETIISIRHPKDGKIILQRSLTPKVHLDEPLRIKLLTGN